MNNARLWIRWSLRDLKARWVQVASIALIIALGTGTYAGMTSVTKWRLLSNDASYDVTRMYDLRVRLSAGSFAQAGTLAAGIAELEHGDWVDAVEERLLLPTQVEVTVDEETVLVPGRVVGMDLSDGGPHVNSLHVDPGQPLDSTDSGQDVAILERHFAKHYDLPSEGQIRVAGDRLLRYVGHALAPEYFMVITEDGSLLAEANFAVVFTSLETAQRLAGLGGVVNDLVLTLIDGVDPDVVAAELEQRFDTDAVIVMRAEDDISYRQVTRDPEGDQQFYNVFALALFAGAVFAAFNLTTRMVEAQRREIGIGMALGVSARTLAIRPLLVGAQIALLGIVFGVGIGVLIGNAMRGFMTGFFPLPVWETPFQPTLFAQVAIIGFLVPFLAISYPVWRAVRVNPVDAIKTGHLAARGGGLAPLLSRIPLPGDTFGQMPFRNTLRAVRRGVLTALGIAAVITVLVGTVGMVDAFMSTLDQGEKEVLGDSPDRLAIDLDNTYAGSSPQLTAVMEANTLSSAEPGLRLGGALISPKEELDVLLLLVDFDSNLWRPTAIEGALDPGTPGVVIARKAARDLDVKPGDTVTVRHPLSQGPYSFTFAETELPVLAIHPNPFRFNVYMDIRHADLMGLEGAANVVYAEPAEDASESAVKRQLFGLTGVAAVQGVAASAQLMRDLMAQFVGILQVLEVAVLALALLIAFNASSISADERAREHATMFAFGVPVRTVLRMAVVESLIIGLIATAVGFAGGYAMLTWMVETLAEGSMPDMGLEVVFSPTTLAIALGLGTLAVAAAPLLTVRKLRRMNIPSTLRVME